MTPTTRISPWTCILLLLMATTCAAAADCFKRPNILLIWGDDIGWADFQRNDPRMRTPNLERLASMGMFMDNSYVQQSCVPSRSSLMTGRYPHNFGFQITNIMGNRLAWLNETETLLPQILKRFGYRTHMIGKWHLGFCDWDLTPTGRGFDTFYGMLMGASGYYNHSAYESDNPQNNTYDLWDNREIDWSAYGKYSTDLFTARAREIIRNAPTTNPWFLYLSYQAAHGPFEVPEHYVTKYCSHVTDRPRQIHCAMVAVMDEGIGLVMDELETKGIMDNTLILYMSDNGGPVSNGGYSSNYPLRGGKQGLWEGGTKSFTVYKGPGNMAATNVTYSGLFHAVDVLPTLAAAAGRGAYIQPPHLDGHNIYWSLQKNKPSAREWMLYGVNDVKATRAIRKGKWKLVQGSAGNQNGWYPSADQQADGALYEPIGNREIAEATWFLFNLEEDPGERNNLYDAMLVSDPVLIAEMKNKAQTYWDQMIPWVLAEKSNLATQLRIQAGHWVPGWCDVTVA